MVLRFDFHLLSWLPGHVKDGTMNPSVFFDPLSSWKYEPKTGGKDLKVTFHSHLSSHCSILKVTVPFSKSLDTFTKIHKYIKYTKYINTSNTPNTPNT